MKTLDLQRVSVRFGKVEALRDVTLEVKAGETMILVGPNGAGKSTLVKVILGLVRPAAGVLVVDGKRRRVDNAFKCHLGYLPEAVAFAESSTGRQVLSFFARARGVEKGRVDEVLSFVGLSSASRRAVRGCSRGMRQRLGLGVAILAKPELLILDEPTGGLDQEGLSVLWSVLAEWRKAGRMVLMATHDLALVERRVDRMCLLDAGSVVAVDTPAKLRERAELPVRVVFSLAEDTNGVTPFVERVQGWNGGSRAALDGDQLLVDVPPAGLLDLLELRQQYAGAIAGVRVIEPGLDAVYERLLERRQ